MHINENKCVISQKAYYDASIDKVGTTTYRKVSNKSCAEAIRDIQGKDDWKITSTESYPTDHMRWACTSGENPNFSACAACNLDGETDIDGTGYVRFYNMKNTGTLTQLDEDEDARSANQCAKACNRKDNCGAMQYRGPGDCILFGESAQNTSVEPIDDDDVPRAYWVKTPFSGEVMDP